MSGPTEESRAYPLELKPGARVGRWRIVAPLGSGSYGAVYLAEDEDAPGVTYALKLALRPSDTRAEREVELLAATEHPNVVRVHDWGTWQGVAGTHLYFVMDWIQGLPLHTWVETTNPPLRELERVAGILALTLDWLHARGVRHRDLKPEHILIRASDSRPFLIDFGVGRQEGASTLTSTVVPPGTVHLRSPEALEFHRLHFRDPGARYAFQPTDDLYALGVCLFRALTGHYPFPPDLPSDLLMFSILLHVPPPVSDINPRVPPALSKLVARLLEKKPQARHGSGRELHQDLEAALALGPASAWDERVFAWAEGSEQAAPSERRTVLPDFPWAMGSPVPEGEVSPSRRPTTGRRVVGAMLIPASSPEGQALRERTLVRVGGAPPRERAARREPGRRVLRAGRVVARDALILLGIVALVAVWRGGGSLMPALGPWAAPAGARLAEAAPPRTAEPPEEAREPEPPPAPTLVESPASADAAPMTQSNDTPDVKPPPSSKPVAKKRSKTPDAVRATAVALCMGAACAGPQQTGPERVLAALRQPRPPPEECPPGAAEAMKELRVGKEGATRPDGFIVPFETGMATLREGPAVFELDDSLGTLPRNGTKVFGRLFFAEGRIHGWFTEARTRDGRRLPVCVVLLDSDGAVGMQPEGAGDEPGTVLSLPLGKVRWVKRFQ